MGLLTPALVWVGMGLPSLNLQYSLEALEVVRVKERVGVEEGDSRSCCSEGGRRKGSSYLE